MEVLALGISHSGTESVKRALELLGHGRVYHGFNLNKSTDGWTWSTLTERRYGNASGPIGQDEFDRILGDCGAVTDFPCYAFWSELMDAYPEAKVVLVERDNLDAWYRSFDQVIVEMAYCWQKRVLSLAMRLGLIPQSPNAFIAPHLKAYINSPTRTDMA